MRNKRDMGYNVSLVSAFDKSINYLKIYSVSIKLVVLLFLVQNLNALLRLLNQAYNYIYECRFQLNKFMSYNVIVP